MISSYSKTDVVFSLHLRPTEKEQAILKFIVKYGRVDFKNLKYGEENPKDESDTFYFKECEDLLSVGFIMEDINQHYSFILSNTGTFFVKDNPLFKKRESNKPCCYKCGDEIKQGIEWCVGYNYCPSCKEDRLSNGEKHPFNK